MLRRWLASLSVIIAACSSTPPSTPRAASLEASSANPKSVHVALDGLGVPTVEANTREEALFALGYLTAQDRLFQMDLLRRRMTGRLAELFGPDLVASDQQQRTYGFEHVARASFRNMSAGERAAIEAYTNGVNACLAEDPALPLEFGVLEYRPEAWRPEDSVLVVLSMFQGLGGTEEQERTRTVLARTLPLSAYYFLTASTDRFTRQLLGKDAAPEPEIPLAELQKLAAYERPSATFLLAQAGEARRGSNAWAVAGTRTRDGRAILANDMHLDLGVPNVWYRAALRYGEVSLDGVFLPGVPVLIAGTNHHIAWGLTSLEADVLDLVEIEVDAADPNVYLTPAGLQRFETRQERIRVRGADDIMFEVRSTVWGPVAQKPLLGRPVAVRWSALDPQAMGIELIDLDRARDVDQAVQVLTHARGPATNVLLADEHGAIAWTVTGKFPKREGFDGAVSVSWADGKQQWAGYVDPSSLPREKTPNSGILVNANQRFIEGKNLNLSHDYANGSRAFRISERLSSKTGLGEAELLEVQLDTRANFFDFYRAFITSSAQGTGVEKDAANTKGVLTRALNAVARWDGKAEVSSIGLGLLVRFRQHLAEELFSPIVARCQQAEATFEYTLDFDAPLERILSERSPKLLPKGAASWNTFVLATLERAATELETEHSGRTIDQLTWGEHNRVEVQHPLGTLPGLESLNMTSEPLPGCGFCVRVASGSLGATERLVVSPGREAEGLFHMPGGQSGDPNSPHYRDQQQAWVQGLATPLLAGSSQSTFTLIPNIRSAHGH